MKYTSILAEMQDTDQDFSLPSEEATNDQYSLGTSVTIEIESFDEIVDGIKEEDRETVKQKIEAGERAIIFDEDDESVDVVFRDGCEIFGVPHSCLTNVDQPESGPDFDLETNL
jgi:hypothetical protein